MSAKRCPLCGEPVSGDECFSCGYIFPDFEKISAPYDLDPSNDLFGAAAEETESVSLLPDMDSLETESMPPLRTPVMNETGANAQMGGAAFRSAQANAAPNIQVRPTAAPTAAVPQGPNPPRQAQPYGQNSPQQYNPQTPAQYLPPGNFSPSNIGTSIVRSVVDFVTKHWWQFLLMFILPLAGMIIGVFYIGIGKFDKKFERSVLGLVFCFLSVMLMANGIDIFGMNEYLLEMLYMF